MSDFKSYIVTTIPWLKSIAVVVFLLYFTVNSYDHVRMVS